MASSIGGLVSGLDTADIIDQLIAVSRKRIDVVAGNQLEKNDKLAAYQSLNTQLLNFKSIADKLRDSDTFEVFKTSISSDSANFTANDLLSVSVNEDASPGTHTIEFVSSGTSQLAQARQLSSASFTSDTSDLNYSGEFVINGSVISVSTTDSLSDIVSLINTANSGTDATLVTATLLSVSDTDNRIVLTSDETGDDMFTILDVSADTENIVNTLGFTDGNTSIKNATSDGANSDEFSSSTTVIESLYGLSSGNSSATISIGTGTVSIDLAADSLTDIASTINAVSGVTASVESTTTDEGVTTYYIDISGTTNFGDDEHILETLGIVEGDNGSVNEIHAGSVTNTIDGSIAITQSVTFDNIYNASVGTTDTVTISGTKADGTSITTTTFNIYDSGGSAYKTIDDLLTDIENLYGGPSVVDASVSNGQIVITDQTAGDSQVSLTLITNNEGASSTLDFGTISASTEGYSMQTKAGQDAWVKIDGVVVSRESNLIDDVISGVKIDLARVEDGATVTLTVSRDTNSIKSNINKFITAYNSIIEFVNQEFSYNEDSDTSGVLAGESTLRTVKSILQSTIGGQNNMLTDGFKALSLIGIESDKYGKMSLDSSVFESKLSSNFNDVKRLFIAEGTTTDSEVTYVGHAQETVAGDYNVVITTVATQASTVGSGDLSSAGIGAGVLTYEITDSLTGRSATITLDGGSNNANSLDNIVSTINSELDTEYVEVHVGTTALTISGGTAITGSTLFTAISNTSGWTVGDTFSITGINRSGASVAGSYSISDTSADSVQDLLSAIESVYGNNASASIDSDGYIVLTDDTVGDSELTISISTLRSLDFGTIDTSNTSSVSTGKEGRYAIEITASKSGNFLVITHDSYGSAFGFTITETTYSGSPTAPETAGTFTGVDVVGTINGEDVTGNGQLLVGDEPDSGESTSVEGLAIAVTSTSVGDGDKGKVKVTIGVAEEMYYEILSFTDQFDGFMTARIHGLEDAIDNLQETIDGMEMRLERERIGLEAEFVNLEISLSRLQNVSAFLAQQLG